MSPETFVTPAVILDMVCPYWLVQVYCYITVPQEEAVNQVCILVGVAVIASMLACL